MWIVDIRTMGIVGFVKFEDTVDEIFAVEVLKTARYPEVITENRELLAGTFVLPDESLADLPEDVRVSGMIRKESEKSPVKA